MPRAFTIATLGGIAIIARPSAVFAFVILLWFLAVLFLPNELRDELGAPPSTLTLWSVAFISTLALFGSTILHELGHALVARVRSVPVSHINVSFFGGHADVSEDEQGPLDECMISAAGPLVSSVIAVVGGAALLLIPNQSPPLNMFLYGLFLLNAWLAIYNLLPVPPLDGGRALRGLLHHIRGERMWATNTAVTIGRVIAALLAGASVLALLSSFDVLQALAPDFPRQIGQQVGFLGLFLAWMLNNGARTFQRSTAMQERLAGVIVARVMKPTTSAVPPWTSLEEIVSEHLQNGRIRAVPVVRGEDTLVGLVAVSDVERVPAKDRPNRTAGEIMTPAANLITVTPDDPVELAIRHMAQKHLNQLPVVQDGKLVGMIDRGSIIQLTEPADRR